MNNDLLEMLEGHDPDEARAILEKYQRLMSEDGLREFIKQETSSKEKKQEQSDLEKLQASYQSEIETASRNRAGATVIANIKNKYRQLGLRVW